MDFAFDLADYLITSKCKRSGEYDPSMGYYGTFVVSWQGNALCYLLGAHNACQFVYNYLSLLVKDKEFFFVCVICTLYRNIPFTSRWESFLWSCSGLPGAYTEYGKWWLWWTYNEVKEIVRQCVVRIGITSNIWYDYW